MPPILREDPYGGFNFIVEIDGISDDGKAYQGAFMEVANLEAEVAAIDYRNGNEEMRLRKLPGLSKYKAITFKRGVIGDLRFWNWIRKAATGNQELRASTGRVILRNEAGEEVMRWNLTRCWPSKYTGPSLNAKNSEIALETLEMQIERLEIDGQSP
ncbi:MAG TPA: phage tail protein [Kofleriaceae bacterium]|nr:phage tail protein [Kofleriaceae bacterium]